MDRLSDLFQLRALSLLSHFLPFPGPCFSFARSALVSRCCSCALLPLFMRASAADSIAATVLLRLCISASSFRQARLLFHTPLLLLEDAISLFRPPLLFTLAAPSIQGSDATLQSVRPDLSSSSGRFLRSFLNSSASFRSVFAALASCSSRATTAIFTALSFCAQRSCSCGLAHPGGGCRMELFVDS